jgi:hypothetical protein
MEMGSPLSPIISNIYMEFFEQVALADAKYKPALWLRYADDTILIPKHGKAELQNFLIT